MKIQDSMDVSQRSKEYILVCFYILIEPATWITKKNQILWLWEEDGGRGIGNIQETLTGLLQIPNYVGN